MNTDQGSQFTSFAWTDQLRRAGIRISMDGKGRFLDNIFVERLWRSMKYECVYLGIMEGPKEDKSGWSGFLRHLVDRGLTGVQLVVSDACRGLVESAAEFLPDAQWQRCVVHFYRNAFSLVPSGRVRDVSKMLKAIHAQEDRKAAAEKMRTVIADLRAMKLVKAAELLEESGHETLTYYGFPDSHWIKLRTNNPLERIMREIRRRTRVVGAFPDGKSCLNLAAARLRHIA